MRGERGVHVGRDRWLFWLGDVGQVPRLYRRGPRDLLRIWRWRRLIARRTRRLGRLGVAYLQVFVPDKLTIYPDRTARRLADPRRSFALAMARTPGVVDLVAPLRAARSSGETYLRTDTHWTHLGYVTAYRTLCAALGVAPAPAVLDAAPLAPVDVLLDLGSKLTPAETERFTPAEFARAARRTEVNALAAYREARHGEAFAPGFQTGSRAVYRNTAATDPRSVVVFGDSYAFHHQGLGPMLAEAFAEVHLLWSSGLDWGYIERVGPAVVVHETAERFARMFPRDGVDVEGLSEARVRSATAAAGAQDG